MSVLDAVCSSVLCLTSETCIPTSRAAAQPRIDLTTQILNPQQATCVPQASDRRHKAVKLRLLMCVIA